MFYLLVFNGKIILFFFQKDRDFYFCEDMTFQITILRCLLQKLRDSPRFIFYAHVYTHVGRIAETFSIEFWSITKLIIASMLTYVYMDFNNFIDNKS